MSDNQFDFGPAAKQIESLKGAANGLASLDSNGLVPSSQLPGATQSVAGLMSAADKTKLDGIASGAQVNPGNATQSAAGLMSAADKTKLDGIATGATANVVSDSLSDTSTTNALSAAKGKALNDSVTELNTQIGNLDTVDAIGFTAGSKFTVESARISILGVYALATVHVIANEAASSSDVMAVAPANYRPTSTATANLNIYKPASGNLPAFWASYATINQNGEVKQSAVSSVAANSEFTIAFFYRIKSIRA